MRVVADDVLAFGVEVSSLVERDWEVVLEELEVCRAPEVVRPAPPTPESKKGSPKVNFPSTQWFSKVETVS